MKPFFRLAPALLIGISVAAFIPSAGAQEGSTANPSGETSQGNSLQWRGNVNGTVYLHIRADTVKPVVRFGRLPQEVSYEFASPLPAKKVNVQLTEREGRGSITVTRQPNSANDYTAIVRIMDRAGGAANYSFRLVW